MRKHRKDKLAALTSGAALISLGAFGGCKSEPSTTFEPPHVNATATPMPSDTQPAASASTAPSALPIGMNAPPVMMGDAGRAAVPHTVNATATPPPIKPSTAPTPHTINAPNSQ